jgi:hypothetical protein
LGDTYMLAVALEGSGSSAADPLPLVRWFSQDSLPLRSIAAIKAAESPAKTVSPKM